MSERSSQDQTMSLNDGGRAGGEPLRVDISIRSRFVLGGAGFSWVAAAKRLSYAFALVAVILGLTQGRLNCQDSRRLLEVASDPRASVDAGCAEMVPDAVSRDACDPGTLALRNPPQVPRLSLRGRQQIG